MILVAACSWASPGANPYQGSPAAAVAHYADIPAGVRATLQARIERRQYDDVAAITRDGIQGQHEYTGLSDMHFGKRTICGRPDRSGWPDGMTERGLVYCEAEHCIIVPTVCRNVSRVTRIKHVPPMTEAPASGGGGLVLDAPTWAAAPSFATVVHADPLPTPVVVSRAAADAPVIQWGAPVGPIYLLAPSAPIPEPGRWLLMLAGLLGMAAVKWRRDDV
jgi:hypothetical protein